MRILAIAAAATTLSVGSAAMAAPAQVQVAIGPALQATAEKTYGVRDVRELAEELKSDVERQLARTHAYDDARIELTLVDAVPNRPTFKQMGDRPGLSFQSFGVGGAEIEGRIVTLDGRTTPLAYRYYETDIRYARHNSTWSDAEWTFQQFAGRLRRGDGYASR
jgi:hypothetical protein